VPYYANDIPVVPRIDNPVDPKIVSELSKKFADFRRAYTEDGLTLEIFDSFGPTRRTLRQFIAGCGDLGAIIRISCCRSSNVSRHGIGAKKGTVISE
jgi:transaldolase